MVRSSTPKGQWASSPRTKPTPYSGKGWFFGGRGSPSLVERARDRAKGDGPNLRPPPVPGSERREARGGGPAGRLSPSFLLSPGRTGGGETMRRKQAGARPPPAPREGAKKLRRTPFLLLTRGLLPGALRGLGAGFFPRPRRRGMEPLSAKGDFRGLPSPPVLLAESAGKKGE